MGAVQEALDTPVLQLLEIEQMELRQLAELKNRVTNVDLLAILSCGGFYALLSEGMRLRGFGVLLRDFF